MGHPARGFDLATGRFREAYAALMAALESRAKLQQMLGCNLGWDQNIGDQTSLREKKHPNTGYFWVFFVWFLDSMAETHFFKRTTCPVRTLSEYQLRSEVGGKLDQ